MRNLTLEEVNTTFQTLCDESGKLFIPDATRDEAIIRNIVLYYSKYHDNDLLLACIKSFIGSAPDPILVYDFAIEQGQIRNRLLKNRRIAENFEKVARETEEKMKEYG